MFDCLLSGLLRFVQTNLNAISSCPQIEQADNVVAFIVLFKCMPSLISDMEYQKIEILVKVYNLHTQEGHGQEVFIKSFWDPLVPTSGMTSIEFVI